MHFEKSTRKMKDENQKQPDVGYILWYGHVKRMLDRKLPKQSLQWQRI